MTEQADGWYGFLLRGIGWVEVAMAKVDGLPEIVGLRMDVRPMWVTEDELHLLDTMTHDKQRQWAIDNAPPGAASGAVITAERLRSLPLAEMRAAVAARLAGNDAFGAFGKVARERGKAWPDEHYRQVAEVYKSAVEHREPPLKAIQEHWHVTRPAAAKYVKGARDRGLLGWPERAGIAGYDATQSPFTSDSMSTPSDRRT